MHNQNATTKNFSTSHAIMVSIRPVNLPPLVKSLHSTACSRIPTLPPPPLPHDTTPKQQYGASLFSLSISQSRHKVTNSAVYEPNYESKPETGCLSCLSSKGMCNRQSRPTFWKGSIYSSHYTSLYPYVLPLNGRGMLKQPAIAIPGGPHRAPTTLVQMYQWPCVLLQLTSTDYHTLASSRTSSS